VKTKGAGIVLEAGKACAACAYLPSSQVSGHRCGRGGDGRQVSVQGFQTNSNDSWIHHAIQPRSHTLHDASLTVRR